MALKILPAALGAEPERRERFEREAQAIAALSHPNIVTIYSVERIDDVPFLTMELVQGRPLTDLIPPNGLKVDQLRRALPPDPDFVQAHRFLALTYGLKGTGDLAIAESHRLIELGDVSGRGVLAQSYASTGQKAEATTLLTELVNEARRSPGKSYGVAAIFAVLGDRDQAFLWLEQAFKERDGNLLSLAVALEFDGLRADPRFKDLVGRIGIPIGKT